MRFKLLSYLDRHPLQKRLAKWWVGLGLPVPQRFLRQIANQIHAEMITRIMERAAAKGSITFEEAFQVQYDLGREIAPAIAEFLSLNAADARSLTRIVDFTNLLLDIRGAEVERSARRVVRHERVCFLADQLAERQAPYYCKLYQSMYKGVLSVLNPAASANDLTITQSIGCDHCEIITEVGSVAGGGWDEGAPEPRRRSQSSSP